MADYDGNGLAAFNDARSRGWSGSVTLSDLEKLSAGNPIAHGIAAAWPDAPPSRADQAYQTSIDRWKQLGRDAFFAPANGLKAFMDAPTFDNALGVMPMGGIGKMPIRPPTGIRAYHGSPYDFDRFDMSRIGTGEGAQAYGHGLYFAENPKTATAYRNTLAEPKLMVTDSRGTQFNPLYHPDGAVRDAAGFLAESGGDIKSAISEWKDFYKKYPNEDRTERVGSILTGWQNRGYDFKPGGKMYEVNINAKPEQFLDWEGKLTGDQMASLEPFTSRITSREHKSGAYDWLYTGDKFSGGNRKPFSLDGMTNGQELYRTISMAEPYKAMRGPEAASEVLKRADIPGIRYLDQGSRGQGAGTSNYVLFNDKIVDIMKKWSLAGAIPFAAASDYDGRF